MRLMAKTRTMIAAYFGGNKKKNWIGSAPTKPLVELLIKAHMDATGKKRKDYKTFTYTDDPEKLGPPD